MRIKNIFKLAIKDLRREKKNFWLCAFGISVGIWLLVLTVSFGEGIRMEVKKNIALMSDLNIINVFYFPEPREGEENLGDLVGVDFFETTKEIKNETIQEIKNFPEVSDVYRPYEMNADFKIGQIETVHDAIAGVPLETVGQVKKLHIIEGRFLEKENEIVLDSSTANNFDKNFKNLVGKNITVSPFFYNLKTYDGNDDDNYLSSRKFKIVGIIESGENITDLHFGSSYIHFNKAKEIYREKMTIFEMPSFKESYKDIKAEYGDDLEGLTQEDLKDWAREDSTLSAKDDPVPFVAKVFVEDIKDVKKVISQLKKMGFATESAQSLIDQINKAIFVLEAILATFGIIALFASIFGIVNVMYLMARERKREIGILKSVGARKNDIVLMFLAEGGFIGLVGGMMGIFSAFITGKLFSLVLNKIFFSELGEEGILGMGIPQISSHIPIWLFLLSLAIAIFFAVVAASAPAERAAKTKTVEMLKYD